MSLPLDSFRANLRRVRDLGGLHDALRNQTAAQLDLSDILRAELVFAVSCLDHYVREMTRVGMLEIHGGQRAPTRGFIRFPVSLGAIPETPEQMALDDWLEEEIRTRHQWQTFQHPDKIADAIRLVSEIELWEEVGAKLGMPSTDVKKQLQLIVDRRNKIAHEADVDPTYGTLWPIDTNLVNGAVDFVARMVDAIDELICP